VSVRFFNLKNEIHPLLFDFEAKGVADVKKGRESMGFSA
jgi:hypothetical protein